MNDLFSPDNFQPPDLAGMLTTLALFLVAAGLWGEVFLTALRSAGS